MQDSLYMPEKRASRKECHQGQLQMSERETMTFKNLEGSNSRYYPPEECSLQASGARVD